MKNGLRIELITEYMEKNNMSKTAFCKACKLSPSVYDKIMNGQGNFRLKNLVKITKFLNIKLSEIFACKEDKS